MRPLVKMAKKTNPRSMKLKLNPHQKRLPFGGHHFREDGIMLKGEAFKDVEELLRDFRLMNGRPVGNPSQDIIIYYAQKFPWMVMTDHDATPDEPEEYDYVCWRDWITSVWGKVQNKFITRKEASFRWEKCNGCPNNVGKTWKSSAEATEFERKSLLLRRGEKTPENYCYCALHRADVSVASFLESPRDLSRKLPNSAEQEGCWF